jgi:translation initiation factor 2 alpha subunit (eIF-2alpha)
MASDHAHRESTDESQTRYERTKRDFEEMNLEQKASFLLEATASTLARGLEEVGRSVGEELEDLFRRARKRHRTSKKKDPHGPGAAEPETSQRSAPR